MWTKKALNCLGCLLSNNYYPLLHSNEIYTWIWMILHSPMYNKNCIIPQALFFTALPLSWSVYTVPSNLSHLRNFLLIFIFQLKLLNFISMTFSLFLILFRASISWDSWIGEGLKMVLLLYSFLFLLSVGRSLESEWSKL